MAPELRRALTAAGLAVALLAGALSLGGRSLPGRADFAFCNQQEVASLDPAIATGVPEGRILRALFEGLTRVDPRTAAPLPGMASSWTRSADGLTWRFTLRSDSTWTTGDPVTAHDFVYSFRRVLRPQTAAPYAYLLWVLEGGEEFSSALGRGETPDESALGVLAAGDFELVLRLARPCPYLPRLLSYHPFLPVHRGCVETFGSRWIKPEHIVTNGPFRLVARRVRDRIRLRRHDGYWGRDEVALASIDAYASDGLTTQLNLYLTGEVDWIVKPPASLYDVLLGRDDVVAGPQAGITFFRFQVRRPPFDDPRVRRALTLALDRGRLARDVLRAGQRGARSFVPDGMPDYVSPALAAPDPARAQALLALAGFPGGEGFPPFELLYPHNASTRDFCEAVAEQWRSVLGIQAHLVNQSWKVYLDSQRGGLYDVSWSSWIADYLEPGTFLEIFTSWSGNNRTGWANERYDALVRAAAAEANGEVRAELYGQAEALLLEQLPIAPAYQRVNLHLVSPRVHGFFDNLQDIHPLRDLSVEPSRS